MPGTEIFCLIQIYFIEEVYTFEKRENNYYIICLAQITFGDMPHDIHVAKHSDMSPANSHSISSLFKKSKAKSKGWKW